MPRRLAFFIFLLSPLVQVRADQGPFDFARDLQPFLSQHCLRCHDDKNQKGDFRLDTLSREVGINDTPLWAEVMMRISSGEMPPEDEQILPSPEERTSVVQWIATRLKEGEAARMATREKVSFHRLSREEYAHTILDLLGVEYDAADPGGITEDPEYQGFERLGAVLSLSPGHVEKYFQASETILNEAFPEKKSELFALDRMAVDPNRNSAEQKERLKAAGADHFRYDLWPQDQFRYANPGRLPAAGTYEMSITLSGLKPADGPAPRLHVYHEDLDRVLFAQDVVAAEDEPVTITFQTHLPEGNQKIIVWNDVPGPSNLPRSGRHGNEPFISIKDGRIPWQLKLTDEDGQPLYPFLIIDRVTWRGPLVSEENSRLRALAFPSGPVSREELAVRLGKLAERAFRRPLREGELDKYLGIFDSELSIDGSFHSAVKSTLQAILCSKSFLFLSEGSDDPLRNELNAWELASRLSYFLWNTMPDDKLFAVAADGSLVRPEVRQTELRRLLADPRSRRFSDSFSRQWLHLRKVGLFPPDKNLYPDYDLHLEKSMIAETQAFFHEVLINDLSLSEFIDSKWTMLNPRLASHYGIKGIEGDPFRRAFLSPEDHRGGLLTQAAILSLTSDGTRHRPVHRGVWISESILGKSPPPPPANVNPVEPNPPDSPKATFREKLEAHKHDANCASCHARIDPYGLAFENYDAIGAWRTVEKVAQGVGENPPVDASGTLHDGRKFAGVSDFKQLLLADLDTFNRAFIEKLATYGLRRPLSYDDREELEKIAANSRGSDYQLRAIVEALVISDLFIKR